MEVEGEDMRNESRTHMKTLITKVDVVPENTEEKSAEGGNPSMLYDVKDTPPLPILLGFAAQMCVNMVSPIISMTAVLVIAVCGSNLIATKMLSTMGLLAGITTLLQSAVGFRLPLQQGTCIYHVLAVVNRFSSPEHSCPDGIRNATVSINGTESIDSLAEHRLQLTVWSLVAASAIHIALGVSGVVGLLVRYIGPVTVVPPLFLLVLELTHVVKQLSEPSGGVAVLSAIAVIISSVYMGDVNVPLPSWNRKRGLHVRTSKLFRMFGITIGIGLGWLLCVVLTLTGNFSSDPTSPQYRARTDRTADNVNMASWFYIPHPGQFGPARFDLELFIGYTVAVLVSILDSVADYKATAGILRVPDPPAHAINRGLFIEGVCSLVTGALGGGHATTTYNGFIGDMLITGMSSRVAVMVTAVLLMMTSVLGKVSAFLISIPYPVLGGITAIAIANLAGTILSLLAEVDMTLVRNAVAVGVSIVTGYLLPPFVHTKPSAFDVGNATATQVLMSVMGNALLVSGVLACFLDNTLPGEGRKSKSQLETAEDMSIKCSRSHLYDLPFGTSWLRRHRLSRYIPILPGFHGN